MLEWMNHRNANYHCERNLSIDIFRMANIINSHYMHYIALFLSFSLARFSWIQWYSVRTKLLPSTCLPNSSIHISCMNVRNCNKLSDEHFTFMKISFLVCSFKKFFPIFHLFDFFFFHAVNTMRTALNSTRVSFRSVSIDESISDIFTQYVFFEYWKKKKQKRIEIR